jgi:UDP-glucose 4-epimerase
MNRILVTGGAGFIGSNLIPLLLEKGYTVNVYDNLFSGKMENLAKVQKHPKFRFMRGDIRDKATLSNALDGIDAIVHLAALIDVTASVEDPTVTHEVNVTGTLNVLQEATKNKVKKIIFASSTAVYGDTKTLPVKEDAPLYPISPYAASKAASEAYLHAFKKCYDIDTVALRFFNVFGPRNENSPYSGVITKFLRKALNHEPLTVEGDGEQTRDFIHVTDIAKALTLALEAENVGGQAFNICTGKPTSVNNIADAIATSTKQKLQVTHGPARVGDIRHSYGDPTKATNQLGFKARITLAEGLKTLLEAT